MISSLRIENWVIVAEAELELAPGLNVLTGETGTGKSIVLGALALLAGGRASPDAVRAGAERAVIDAVLSAEGSLADALAQRGLEADDGEVPVQRTVVRGGRARVRVAGELVPASVLAELLADRIEISSQHGTQTLLRPETQGVLLDEAGGLLELRAEVEQAVAVIRGLDEELASLRARAEERAREQDFLSFQLREIDDAGLQPGEIRELETTHARLAHADRLQAEGFAACAALVGADGADDVANALDRVAEAARILGGLSALDPALGVLAERLRAQESELFEVGRDLERALQSVEADPARLAEIEDRMAGVAALQRKYGRSEEEIAAFRARVAADLESAFGADARIDTLERERGERVAALEALASRLTSGRADAARSLSEGVEAQLSRLALPGARISIRLESVKPPAGLPCGPGGAERVEMLFSANAGESPRPLRTVASGGELSRVYLALRNALRRSGAGMVLVFDEVDAGIGGRAAERVGRALSELARHHQVLCITHLPQIAAFGERHFRVTKRERGGRTQAAVERIEGDARVDEIARMAGGERVTAATRRHARDLMRAKATARGA